MQRIFNIDKWSRIPQGKAMKFAGDRPRKVVLEVNCPVRTQLSLVNESGTHFLALVEGRDSIEFYVNGAFSIASSGSDCYIYTVDGQGVTFEKLDAASFAVVRERRARNPELEYIARRMQENLERRLAMQADELRKVLERRSAPREPQSAASGVVDGGEPDGASDDDGKPEGGASPSAGRGRKRMSVGTREDEGP